MHHFDNTYQFAFLFIHDTLQKCNPRKIFTIAQLYKILPECKQFKPEIVFKQISS